MEKQNTNQKKNWNEIREELVTCDTCQKLATLIDENILFFSENRFDITFAIILTIKDPKFIKNNTGNDKGLMNLFSSIEKINPNSTDLIRLLFLMEKKENIKRIIEEKKKTIIRVLNSVYITPNSPDDLTLDGDSYDEKEYIIYNYYCRNIEANLTLIEELIPYLTPSTCSLKENTIFLSRSTELISNYLEKRIEEGKIPLNFLLQMIKLITMEDITIKNEWIDHLDHIEIEINGSENLLDIKKCIKTLSYLKIDLKTQEKIIEKIISAITNSRLETLETTDINELKTDFNLYIAARKTMTYFKMLIDIQEQLEQNIPLEKCTLYKECQKIFLSSQVKRNQDSAWQDKLQSTFQNWILEIEKEPSKIAKQRRIILELPELLKIRTEKERILFEKLGIRIKEANNFQEEELYAINPREYYEIYEKIKSRSTIEDEKSKEEIPQYAKLTEFDCFALRLLLTFKKEISLYLLNVPSLNTLYTKLNQTNDINNSPLWLPILEKLALLSKLYQRNIPYKETKSYQEAWKMYKKIIQEKIKITDHSYDKYIRFMFHKLIRTGDIFTFLIDIFSLKEILLFYKTNSLNFDTTYCEIQEIESLNPKQWNDIKKQILTLTEQKGTKVEKEVNTFAFHLTTLLGYEIAKKLLNQTNITYTSLADFTTGLKGIKVPYDTIQEFRICIKEHPDIFALSSELLQNYYLWYLDLSRNLQKRITYEDIVQMEDITKEKFLEQANYYPISKNIYWVERRDSYKRNLFKTGMLWLKQKERLHSTIPEYHGEIENYKYGFVDLHDPDLIFLPNMINCCMTIGNKAEADLIHAATNENGRLFAVYKEDKIIAISWVWRNGQVLCFDNIEVKREEITEELSNTLLQILKETSQRILEISKEYEPKNESIQTITLGRNKLDIPLNLKDTDLLSNYQEEMYFPEEKDELYMIDSMEKQYIIGGNYTPLTKKGKNTSIRYTYPRKEAINFNEIDKLTLDLMIKAIRKDNDIDLVPPVYTLGYIGEDFYLGITSKGKIDIIAKRTDSRVNQEIEILLEKLMQQQKIKIEKEEKRKQQIEQITNTEYQIKPQEFQRLINQIKASPTYQMDPGDYYHGSPIKKIIEIIEKKEIRCTYLLGYRTTGYNGSFHISVAKNLNINKGAFDGYIKNGKSLILKKDLPVITKNSTEYNFLNPFFQEGGKRSYGYEDEFQVKEKIEKEYFKGLYVPTTTKEEFTELRKIIEALETFDLDLPIISNTSNTIIDKELIKKYVIPS